MELNAKQKMNMLAIEVLEQFGCYEPTQTQIDNMEAQLQRMMMTSVFPCVATAENAPKIVAH